MFKSKNAGIGVIGLGRFGMPLARQLSQAGKDVAVLDNDENKIREARTFTDFAYVVDNLKKETMEEVGIHNCETVIVCIGEKMDISILATLNVLSLGVPKVIAKANSPEQGYVLEKLGAEVVYPEQDMAVRLAKRIVAQNVLDYISLSDEIEITEVQVPRNLCGKSVCEADLRKKFGLNIIAIERNRDIQIEIKPEYQFQDGDIIVVIGKKDKISVLENS